MDTRIIDTVLQNRKITYVVTDADFNIVELSDAVGIFNDDGYETIIGKPLPQLVPELAGNEAVLHDILTGDLSHFELNWVNLELFEGQTLYLNLISLPYCETVGHISGLIQVVQDVTEMGEVHQQLTQRRNELRLLQKQLARQNQELTAANFELQRLNEIKSNFISMAAHELNTPLGAILGYVEMLLDEVYGSISGDQRGPLNTIYDSGRHLAAIVKDLLDVTRIETGRVELTLQPVNLNNLTKTIVYQLEPQLKAKKQVVMVNVQPDLPFALIDETRTVQIITNLLSNANKYSYEDSTITINLTMAEDDGFIQLTVVDNGVGISAKDQENLFSRFYRAESAHLTGATGTGLGLYITLSLVELQGGRIWFESELNVGSRFFVTFPIAGRLK